MPLPIELKPKTMSRVMDLVKEAGVDVSDWPNYDGGATNPAANPKYCYEWALREPGKVVVCNLWSANMREVDGEIEQHLILRDTATHKEMDPTRRARRGRMEALLIEANRERLPVRVIVLDGEMRENSADGKTQVRFRALDPLPWAVAGIDPSTGTIVLRRGALPLGFSDQFDLPKPPDGPGTTATATVNLWNRSEAVRLYVLQRAHGKCELCGARGFPRPDGSIYLETHHVIPLSAGGPDSTANVAALCPSHHREAHYGKEAEAIRANLQARLCGDAGSR